MMDGKQEAGVKPQVPDTALGAERTDGRAAMGVSVPGPEAVYLYGVLESAAHGSLGPIGLDGAEVYLVVHGGLAAVVHNCPDAAYRTGGRAAVEAWVLAHQRVLDVAAARFGPVLPFGFGVIVWGRQESAEAVIRRWLGDEEPGLREKLKKVRGRQEYGIQVFYNVAVLSKDTVAQSERLQELEARIRTSPPGLAYMYQQQLQKLVRQELEGRLDRCYREFCGSIRQHVADVRVEKVKKADGGRVMLMNLSCLVDEDRVRDLGKELQRITDLDGIEVRFTGPWPPYSFVSVGDRNLPEGGVLP